jgi:hypothetical protein
MACNFYTVTIDDVDLLNANGNSDPSRNSVVFASYTDCDGNPQEISYDFAGVFSNDFCSETDPSVFYYNNNNPSSGISDATIGSDCGVTTPTPTPTPTASKKPVVKKISITCVKGKTTKKLTAEKPKCPAGYRKK